MPNGHNRRDSPEARAIKAGFEDVTKWLAIQNETLAGGLAAIALAASTPDDNSGDVQKKLDELTATLKASSDSLQAAVDNAPK